MQPGTQPRPDRAAEGAIAAVAQPPRRVTSADLLRGERRVIIEHGQESYTLILTRNGKLLLTK